MQDNNDNLRTSNKPKHPFAAVTEIFYRPKAVFDVLAVKNNWSWIPFLLVTSVLFFPPYLYFTVVDFAWWQQMTVDLILGDVAPAQKEALLNATTLRASQLSQAITGGIVVPIVGAAFIALYYNLVTRNDEKSVQGFSDWYGAMWWMALPLLVGALLSIVLITLQSPNSQVSNDILNPLSFAFVLNISIASPWHSLLSLLRLDYFASIYLGYIGLRSWTAFSSNKAVITALLPYVVIVIITAVFAMLAT